MFGDAPDTAASKAKGSGDLQSALAGESSQRRGPPKVACVAEAVVIPIPGETDQEYTCRVVRERTTLVEGETHEEAEMVNFYRQVIAASSRGIISSFVVNVMISRHWGKDRKSTDTSQMTVTKTYKQLHAWMHPDHCCVCCGRSKDYQDLIHNGFLALTQAAATLKTKLKSGELVIGITGALPFPKEQKEYVLRPSITSYSSVWSTAEHPASTYVTLVTKPVHILPETPLIPWRAKSGAIYQIAPLIL